jgi:type IV pilus assembly protein PilW
MVMKRLQKIDSQGMIRHCRGFTLIELMVALCIVAILMVSITMAFHTQQESQVREQMVLEMQQNVRAALQVMERDIRMAGYNPVFIFGTDGIDNDDDGEVDEPDEAESNLMTDGIDNDCDDQIDVVDASMGLPEVLGITIARSFKFRFTMDLDNDRHYCGPNEHIEYGFAKKYDGSSGPQDGWADYKGGQNGASGVGPIGRATQTRGTLQPLAQDVEAVAFAYAFDSDQDGELDRNAGHIVWAFDGDNNGALDTVLDTNTDGRIDARDDSDGNGWINAGDGAGLMPEVPLDRIRAVKIWLLARTRYPVRGHRETGTYVVGDKIIRGADVNRDGTIGPEDDGDHHQRRLLSTTVVCRNMGLGNND